MFVFWVRLKGAFEIDRINLEDERENAEVLYNNVNAKLEGRRGDRNYNSDIAQGALFARYKVDFTPSFSVNLGLRQDFNSLVNASFTINHGNSLDGDFDNEFGSLSWG